MIDIGPAQFALLMAGLFLVAFNQRFWRETAAVFWHGDFRDALFLAGLALVLWLGQATALMLIPGRLPMKLCAGVLLPIGAMAAYCADSYGVVIDTGMIRNLGATDRRELHGLLSPGLWIYAAGLGVVPVFLVARCRIAIVPWRRRLPFVAGALAAIALLCALFAPQFKMLGQQRQLHYLSVPGAALTSAAMYLRSEMAAVPPEPVSAAAVPTARLARQPGGRPLLVFLVIGETARHASFALGGYERATNPRLSRVDNLYYFSHAQACATSTAVAVPCMLSPLGRERFLRSGVGHVPNALEELAAAGVKVEWRSNNTSDLEPGAGVAQVPVTAAAKTELCNPQSCLDEILLHGVEQELAGSAADRLLAFHQMGSHGPGYHLRYPAAQEIFRPACRRTDLAACPPEALRNAYDNTIRYTDHVLAEMITLLDSASARYDTALLYVSDHGESLGENGVFLHSAPYRHAPPEQKRVPLLVWMSRPYAERFGLDAACMRANLGAAVSHDHVHHTLLGMMAATSVNYDVGRDMLAPCRVPQRHADDVGIPAGRP